MRCRVATRLTAMDSPSLRATAATPLRFTTLTHASLVVAAFPVAPLGVPAGSEQLVLISRARVFSKRTQCVIHVRIAFAVSPISNCVCRGQQFGYRPICVVHI